MRPTSAALALAMVVALGARRVAAQNEPNEQWRSIIAAAEIAANEIAAGKTAPDVLNRLNNAQHELPPQVARPIDCWDMMVDAQSQRSSNPDFGIKQARAAATCYREKALGSPGTRVARPSRASTPHRDACTSSGYTGIFDEGIPARKPEAIRLVEQACGLYTQGNAAGAAKLYLQAAEEHHDAVAEFRLGMLYERGEGLQKDPARADLWLQRASDQGMQPATAEMVRLHPPPPQSESKFHIPVCLGAAGANSADCERKGGEWRP